MGWPGRRVWNPDPDKWVLGPRPHLGGGRGLGWAGRWAQAGPSHQCLIRLITSSLCPNRSLPLCIALKYFLPYSSQRQLAKEHGEGRGVFESFQPGQAKGRLQPGNRPMKFQIRLQTRQTSSAGTGQPPPPSNQE